MSRAQSVTTVVMQPRLLVRGHLNLSGAWVLREYNNGDTFEDILLERRIFEARSRPGPRDYPAEPSANMIEREVEEDRGSLPPQDHDEDSQSAAPGGQPEAAITPPHMKRTPYGNLAPRPGISPFRLNKGKGISSKENKEVVSYPSGLPAPLNTPQKYKDFANINNPNYQPSPAKANNAANQKKRKSNVQINSDDEILTDEPSELRESAKGGKRKAQPRRKKTSKQRRDEKQQQDDTPSEDDSMGDLPVSKSQKKVKK